jgi:hypothetical protein
VTAKQGTVKSDDELQNMLHSLALLGDLLLRGLVGAGANHRHSTDAAHAG